jgi:hypothetical protein
MEEIKKILEMVNQGKISVEEGTRLIQALGSADKSTQSAVSSGKPKFVRIRVNSSDNDVVNVNIPLSLVKVAMRFVPKEARAELEARDIDIDEVIEAIMRGAEGNIVDVKSGDGDVVQIYVD